VGSTVSAGFTIYMRGGTISGQEYAKLNPGRAAYASFSGSLVSHGGGKYAHASGSGELFRTLDRENDNATVQPSGKLLRGEDPPPPPDGHVNRGVLSGGGEAEDHRCPPAAHPDRSDAGRDQAVAVAAGVADLDLAGRRAAYMYDELASDPRDGQVELGGRRVRTADVGVAGLRTARAADWTVPDFNRPRDWRSDGRMRGLCRVA
jgi:hypothetical protein